MFVKRSRFLNLRDSLLEADVLDYSKSSTFTDVIPAKAGTQAAQELDKSWVAAFAGMTPVRIATMAG